MTKIRKMDKLIKSKKRVKDFAEVYTPQWLVRDMVALTDACQPLVAVLEPSCGNGNFLVHILSQKLDNSKDTEEAFVSLSSIYGIDIQDDNILETRERLKSLFLDRFPNSNIDEINRILEQNIVCGNFLDKKIYSKGKSTDETIQFLKDEYELF